MKTREFFFNLPSSLIAQYPSKKRGHSRLMVVDRASGSITHHGFQSLPKFLSKDTVMVYNDSKVRKARLFAKSQNTGGQVEFLLVKELENGAWQVLCSRMKKQNKGKTYLFPGQRTGYLLAEQDEYRILKFIPPIDDRYLDQYGHMPLPPYIKRADEAIDEQRYQTVYAKAKGSIAAPTAGLHFSSEIIKDLLKHGIKLVPISLHVGLGTFIPIRTQEIEDHRMHSEEYEIAKKSALILNGSIEKQKKILAVGTTSVRALESACKQGRVRAGRAVTDLFIYPGFKFKIVSQLLTNFHTPESSLLVMVSAFAGKELIFRAYEEAKRLEYRFFSYGDAMLIL
jgi:S-adenosylmethionine:tRNA ribosyltransferase-isomerase